MPEKLFPIILIVLNLAAAFVYLAKFNTNQALYWFSAAILNFTVTFKW